MVRQGLFTLLCLHKILAGITIYINLTQQQQQQQSIILVFSPVVLRGEL